MEIVNPRKRARKANAAALVIFFSYAKLLVVRKLYSKGRFNRKLEKLHYKNAARVKKLVVELKGLFIKAGQLMSMMSNILPEAYGSVLESLQDHAPAHDYEGTKETIERELNDSVENLFSEFENEPIASASIGQVHKATLNTGDMVAVKVQHPYIKKIANADLDIIEKIVKRVARFFKIQGIDNVYTQVRSIIEGELDYEEEAVAMRRVKQNLKQNAGVSIPAVFDKYSTKTTLVTSFKEGVKITNIQQLDDWKIDRKELAEKLITVYCDMILRDGYYHADPHPGNILVDKEGTIVLLDFGATAVLNETMRKEIPRLIQAIFRKDHNRILQSLQIMGFVGDDIASKKIAKKLVKALSDFLQNEIKIDKLNADGISIDDLRGSSIENLWKEISIKELSATMQVPKDWIFLDRTMLLLSGISAKLAPELHPLDVVKPYLKKQIFSFDGIKTFLVDAVQQQLSTFLALPTALEKFLSTANNGDLEVTVVDQNTERIYKGIQQLIFTLIGLFGLYIYTQKGGGTIWLILSLLGLMLLLRSFWKNRR